MKKLLIAMTAAAVGTCAWATDADPEPTTPTVTYLNESFGADWTPTAPWWSYTGDATAELAPTNVAAADAEVNYALALNTGSKVLSGNFGGIGANDEPVAVTIPAGRDTGLYFKSTVTFSDPSDTLPELGPNDKFALVVLDNIESVDEGLNTTNLWVIAGHKDDGKRAYLLQPFADDADDYNLTDSWFNTPKTIEVRAIKNVMATVDLAGFIVKVENVICRVVESYPIVDGVINMSSSAVGGTTYLGYSAEEIDATYRTRYETDKTLIVSAAASITLTSVDFQGQGVIDDVSLATTGSDFGSDAVVLTFTGYDANKIASITVGEKAAVNGEYTITGSETADEEGKVTIVVTVKEGYALKGEGWTKNGLTYTYAGYTLPTASAAITLNVFPPAAYVGDEACETVQAALTYIAENGGTGTVVLNNNVTLYDDDIDGYGLTISAGEITIDLNGKTIQAGVNEEDSTTCSTISVSGGKLIVTDSKGGGAILAAEGYSAIDAFAGLTEIKAGTIGLINNNGNADNLKLVGGSYTDATVKVNDEDRFAYAGSVADGFDATLTDDVWTVAERVIVKYTVSASYNNAQVSVSDLTTGEVEENTVLSFTVVALPGFENVVVKAGNTVLEPTNDTYTWTVVANVTITITADAVVVGPSIDDEDGAITVDQNTGNATIETTNATVTVTGIVTGDVIVTPSVGTVNVELAQNKHVYVYFDGKNITGAFTVSSANGTTTIVLDEEGSVNGVSVKPEMAEQAALPEGMTAPFEAGTDVAVGVKTIPGLKYQLIRSDAPNGTFGDVPGASATGTGYPVKLEDKNKPNGKGFYKIKVSQR